MGNILTSGIIGGMKTTATTPSGEKVEVTVTDKYSPIVFNNKRPEEEKKQYCQNIEKRQASALGKFTFQKRLVNNYTH